MEDSQDIQKELEELKQKSEEYLNGWKRERADFLNYKKEEAERAGMLARYAKEDAVLNILPLIDHLYLAQQQFPETLKADTWGQGFLQIIKQAEEFLTAEGIAAIAAVGKPFDPSCMESVEETGGEESGIVDEELQKGYTMDGKVIRPARVKVTR